LKKKLQGKKLKTFFASSARKKTKMSQLQELLNRLEILERKTNYLRDPGIGRIADFWIEKDGQIQ
jgi:hypothetical protein